MKKNSVFPALLIIFGLTYQTLANSQTSHTQWDRGNAMAAVRAVNIDNAVQEIGDISSLTDAATTLSNLKNIETRSDWPLPAREAVVYKFTQSLAELPREAVATEVMQHLNTFQARTLVPHEDHGEAAIPLFNIRAAAAGVENGWQRTEFASEAIKLLESNPTALVAGFKETTNRNQQSGFLDALQYAEITEVVSVQNIALEHLAETPALTPIVAMTTAITTDTFAIQQLLINGRGAGLSSALVNLDKQLPASETASLLAFAIQQAPASNATLAMAAWWPRLRHDPATRDLMMEKLADPALGAGAALALAQSPDIQTIKLLQETASGDSTAARRAQMALDLNRDQLIGQVQP
jgi:hypothetical protein